MAGHRPWARLALTAALVVVAGARAGSPAGGRHGAAAADLSGRGRARHRGRRGRRSQRSGDPGAERIRFHRAGGRPPAGDQQLRGDRAPGLASRGGRRASGAAERLDERPGRGPNHRAHVRGRLRQPQPDADRRPPREGGDRAIPRKGRAGGRPRDAGGDRGRRLVEHAHGGGPPRARVAAQAAGGPPHARPVARAGHALGGDADPRLPRPGGRVARPAAPGEVQRGSLRPDGPHAAPVRPGQPLPLAARLPGVPGQRQPQPRDARAAQAAPGRPRRQPRPQGGAARLGRLRLRHGARRVQARPGSRPALQRRHLLPRRARARGHAGGDDGAVRGGARGARPGDRRLRGRVLRRHHALGRAGLGGRADPRRRERRLHDQEHQRPRRRHRPHRGRVGGLLPARLQAHEHAARRPLPQDRGQARARRGERARAQGLLRGARHERRERERGEETRASSAPSTRPTRAMPSRCA